MFLEVLRTTHYAIRTQKLALTLRRRGPGTHFKGWLDTGLQGFARIQLGGPTPGDGALRSLRWHYRGHQGAYGRQPRGHFHEASHGGRVRSPLCPSSGSEGKAAGVLAFILHPTLASR